MTEAIEAGRPIAFDTSALIPYAEGFPLYVRLLRPFFRADLPGIVISYVTLSESLVRPARDGDLARVEALRAALIGLPGMTAIPLDEKSATATALVRGRTGLKLPDSAIIAAALIGDAHALIGNDRIWKNRDLGLPYHHLDDILALA